MTLLRTLRLFVISVVSKVCFVLGVFLCIVAPTKGSLNEDAPTEMAAAGILMISTGLLLHLLFLRRKI
jgi:hypothetical protein